MNLHLVKLKERYSFTWDSALLLGAGGLAGFVFLVFHAVMKRMMVESDYTSMVALLGLLNFMALPTSAINFTMSRFVAEHVENNAVAAWVTIFRRALRKMTGYSLAGLAVWMLLSGWLADFFAAPSVLSIAVLGVIAVVGLHMPIITGVLQGARMFGQLALISLASPLARLLFCGLAVWLGANVAGVMGAIALSSAAMVLVAAIPFRRIVARTEPLSEYDTQPIYRYLWPVFLSQGALLLLMNADLIFFKRFLYGEYAAQADAYAQAATLSRAVVFIAQPLAVAMFPRAVNSKRPMIFWGPMIFAVLASVVLAALISLFPALPFRLMYGTDDPVCFAIARRYVWAALPLSLAAIALKYLWARHLTGRAMLLVPVVAIYLVLLYFHHRTPGQMIACLGIGSWGALAVLAGAFVVGRDADGRRKTGFGGFR